MISEILREEFPIDWVTSRLYYSCLPCNLRVVHLKKYFFRLKQNIPIHVSRRSTFEPTKPSSTHKPHNKVDRVTREYVKRQIKRELSGRGRAALCSTSCSGEKVSSFLSLNDGESLWNHETHAS